MDHEPIRGSGLPDLDSEPKTKLLTYKITDWVVECCGAPCEEGAVYASTGYGFIGIPRNTTQRLVDKDYKFEPGDAFLDLWCHTVYRDYGNGKLPGKIT